MVDDILAKHRGIIYQSPKHWGMGLSRFIIISQLEDSWGTKLIKVKLLDRPNYKSSHFIQPGYAKVTLNGLKYCTIVEDNRNITEYLKARLSLFQ